MPFSISSHAESFQKVIDFLKSDIASLRTGRATPALVEDISVDAYGVKQPLKAVASISVADAKTLTVDPWDKSLIPEVERAIRQAPIGLSPVNDGKLIRLILPELSQERRGELIKLLHQKLENARIGIRKVREDIRASVDKAEKAKEISEDEKYKYQEELEKLVKEHNATIKQIGEDKEKDITTI